MRWHFALYNSFICLKKTVTLDFLVLFTNEITHTMHTFIILFCLLLLRRTFVELLIQSNEDCLKLSLKDSRDSWQNWHLFSLASACVIMKVCHLHLFLSIFNLNIQVIIYHSDSIVRRHENSIQLCETLLSVSVRSENSVFFHKSISLSQLLPEPTNTHNRSMSKCPPWRVFT